MRRYMPIGFFLFGLVLLIFATEFALFIFALAFFIIASKMLYSTLFGLDRSTKLAQSDELSFSLFLKVIGLFVGSLILLLLAGVCTFDTWKMVTDSNTSWDSDNIIVALYSASIGFMLLSYVIIRSRSLVLAWRNR